MQHLAFLAFICTAGFQKQEILGTECEYPFQWVLSLRISCKFSAYHFYAPWVCAYIFNLSIQSMTLPWSLNIVCSFWFSCNLMGQVSLAWTTHTFKALLTNDGLILFHAKSGLTASWMSVSAHLWSPQSYPLHCALPWWRRAPGRRRWPPESAQQWGKSSSCGELGPLMRPKCLCDQNLRFSVFNICTWPTCCNARSSFLGW